MKSAFAIFMPASFLALCIAQGSGFTEAEQTGHAKFFPQAGETVALPLIKNDKAKVEGVPAYRVIDYSGQTLSKGQAESDGAGGWQARFAPETGFYEVVIEGQDEGQATGLWSQADKSQPNDGFLGVDMAMSWLTKPEARAKQAAGLSQVMGTGVMARERLSWEAINPEDGKWEWEVDLRFPDRRYDSTRQLYAKAGVPLLEMFHDTPAWMGRAQNGRFPDNLPAAAREWQEVAKRWSRLWGALEIWNEPDITFGGRQPADQYAPIVKTIRWAMEKAAPTVPLGAGVYSAFNPAYLELSARNGILDECDFLSFHYYGDAMGIEPLVSKYRGWMAAAGRETKPLWMTEVGMPRPGRSGVRPPAGEQMRTALTYAMQPIEAKASGVALFFPFVYNEYSEHNERRHFGMLDGRGTPLRALAASAQAGYELAKKNYIGDVPVGHIPGAARVRVFAEENGDEALVVIYTGKVEAGAKVKLPFAASAARGVDGRRLEMEDGGRTVPVSDGLAYVTVPRNDLKDILDTSTETMRLWKLGQATPPPLPAASGIVLQPQIDPEAMKVLTVRGYFLKPKAETAEVRVGVNNLTDEEQKVTVRASGAEEQTVTVAAQSREFAVMKVPVEGLPKGVAGDDRLIEITAEAENLTRIAPAALFVIPDVGEDGVAGHLASSTYHFPLTVGEAYRWEKSSNGKLTFGHTPPAAWGFTVQYSSDKDNWAYPKFLVPQEVDPQRVTGVLVRARCLKPAKVNLMSWDDQGEMSVTRTPILPADGKWHTVYVPFVSYSRSFLEEPGKRRAITKISVGFNTKEKENTLEISDLYMIGK